MKPFLKWPGGKTSELNIILKNMPSNIENYYEPFVGGGAVYFGIQDCKNYFINDKSEELINLYIDIQQSNQEFLYNIKEIDKCWKVLEEITNYHIAEIVGLYEKYRNNFLSDIDLANSIKAFILNYANEFNGMLNSNFVIDENHILKELQINISKKLNRMKKLENDKGKLSVLDIKTNIETGFKSGLYMHFRFLYNNINTLKIDKHFANAIFYFIREYCYSSMFRYNKNGGFNVPYGGISYNKKYMTNKITYLENLYLIDRLKKTEICSMDFNAFLAQNKPKKNDFIFLDPPYDSTFSTYSNNIFNFDDHRRLKSFCENTNGKFMLVIKNTDFICDLYNEFNVTSFDKKYTVSFQNRNDKNAEHLLIKNY